MPDDTPDTASESFVLGHDAAGGGVLRLAGALTIATAVRLDAALLALAEPIARLDLAGVTAIDTVGAWLVWRTARDHGAAITGASDRTGRLVAAVQALPDDRDDGAPRRPPLYLRVPAAVGELVIGIGVGSLGVLGLMGALISAIGESIRHPRRLRLTALIRQIELVGVNALGIVGLMSFLIGIVIAQQGAVQLQQFGAQIYTINLTGRLALRELGILMTAIMVAGRSGSAFAAEIGTMKLTEEIDAMRTIGVSPLEALVLPRVLASVLMLPLLGFYSAVIAIIGGATIAALLLDIPFLTFLARIQEVVPVRDLWVGLSKGPVFGLIIALAGCYQGLQVSGNSEEVGRRTTMAVVQAIFMVIVLDAFFAIFFSEIGWI